jgi:hypothetical protein
MRPSIERDLVPKIDDPPIDPGPHIAGSPHVEQFFSILALPSAHDRRDNLELGALRQRENRIDHLLDRLGGDFIPTGEAIGVADAGKQQSKIVVNFRDGSDRRPGIMARALLLDRNRRGKALDGIDIRLPHLFEKLAGVGGQRFDIAALSLRIDRIEGQRGLPGPAQPRDDDEFVPWNLQVQILEIMLPGTPDNDGVTHEVGNYNMRQKRR